MSELPTDLRSPEQPQSPRLRGFRAGLLLLAATVVLSPLHMLPEYWGIVSLGTLGAAAVLWALLYKYRRFQLNAEIVFLFALTAELLVAPTILCISSNNFTASWFSEDVEHHMVRPAYPMAMVIVLLYASCFLLASGCIPERARSRLWDGRLATTFTKRNYIILILFMIQLWLIRYAILANGYFYHGSTNSFRLDDWRLSGWSEASMGLGLILTAFLWTGAFTRNLPIIIALGYTACEFAWNFLSGWREATLMVPIVVLLTYIVYKNRFPWKTVLALSFPTLLMIGFMAHFRSTFGRNETKSSISLEGVMHSITSAFNMSDRDGIAGTMTLALVRLDELGSVAVIYSGTPNQVPYLMGETYSRIPAAFVPRVLWHDKPMVVEPINEWFFRPRVMNTGGSSPITTMGEGYLNFGWFGVVLAGCLSGLLLRATDAFIARRLWNAAIIPVYIGFVGSMARFYTDAMALWLTVPIKLIFFTLLLHYATWFGRPTHESQQPSGQGDLEPEAPDAEQDWHQPIETGHVLGRWS